MQWKICWQHVLVSVRLQYFNWRALCFAYLRVHLPLESKNPATTHSHNTRTNSDSSSSHTRLRFKWIKIVRAQHYVNAGPFPSPAIGKLDDVFQWYRSEWKGTVSGSHQQHFLLFYLLTILFSLALCFPLLDVVGFGRHEYLRLHKREGSDWIFDKPRCARCILRVWKKPGQLE